MSQFGALLAGLGGFVLAAYGMATAGLRVSPSFAVLASAAVTLAVARADVCIGAARDRRDRVGPGAFAVLGIVLVVLAATLAPAWPALLPPGGASDLTHHLALVDTLARTGRLVTDPGADAILGEMAHYTPGVHLLIVLVAELTGLDPLRVVYPLLALTVALKAGALVAIASITLEGVSARTSLALTTPALVLLAPRAYVLDGFLQAGFVAQVAAELFVVGGWLALACWARRPTAAAMVGVGVMAAAVFVVWPVWVGPLMVAVALVTMARRDIAWPARWRAWALAGGPLAVVAVAHLSRHAAWLRLAGTSGAVPDIVVDAPAMLLAVLAVAGLFVARARSTAGVTACMAIGIALQAVALYALARQRGATTPYMAMKMLYLAVYPAAVLAVVALARVVALVPPSRRALASWAACALAALGAAGQVSRVSVPPSIVSLDLDAAGRWALAAVPVACTDYLVRDAERAYWLHLAVMGGSRASARTAELDTYTANAAIGRWVEQRGRRYGIAEADLVPAEVWTTVSVLHRVGTAVVIERAPHAEAADCGPH